MSSENKNVWAAVIAIMVPIVGLVVYSNHTLVEVMREVNESDRSIAIQVSEVTRQAAQALDRVATSEELAIEQRLQLIEESKLRREEFISKQVAFSQLLEQVQLNMDFLKSVLDEGQLRKSDERQLKIWFVRSMQALGRGEELPELPPVEAFQQLNDLRQ